MALSHALGGATKTLAQLSGRNGDFKGYFSECFYKPQEQCLNSAEHDFPVPDSYQITDHRAIFEQAMSFSPPGASAEYTQDIFAWESSKIVTSKMEIYFHLAACPRCALKNFPNEVRLFYNNECDERENSGLSDGDETERLLENVRYYAQSREAALKGLYQSMWERYEKDREYKKLRKEEGYGNWIVVDAKIPGQPGPKMSHEYKPFVATDSTTQRSSRNQ